MDQVAGRTGEQRATVGALAPDFTLRDEKERVWRLADQMGNVTVLLFYPQDETLVCTRQLCSVRDNWASYLATRATIVGISPGSPAEHSAFAQSHRLPISLLADPERTVTAMFAYHSFLPLSFLRAVVVIDAHGIVRNRNVMLRAVRPADDKLITDIYAARGDALAEQYRRLAGSFVRTW